MADNEPGILDVLSYLFSEPGFKCEVCNNEGAIILVNCVCGWKMQGCLPCAMTSGDAAMAPVIEHKRECEKLRHFVKISEACR